MFIFTLFDAKLTKTKIYFLNSKNKQIINEKFNRFYKQNKIN